MADQVEHRGGSHPDRRTVLKGAAAAATAALVGSEGSPSGSSSERQPVAFVSHGAPSLALDSRRGAELARWGRALPEPTAILVVSAHWERSPASLGTTEPRPLLHDYGGFGAALRRVTYPAPASPALAELALDLRADLRREPDRPWDHGVWVPLVHMFPAARIPVLQLSLPSQGDPEAIVELGEQLAPLRDRGVLLLASGGAVHNLRALDLREEQGPDPWAREFDDWLREAVAGGDRQALIDWRRRAPDPARAHPTDEHFTPLLFALGAAGAESTVRFPVEGFEYGNLARRSIEWA